MKLNLTKEEKKKRKAECERKRRARIKEAKSLLIQGKSLFLTYSQAEKQAAKDLQEKPTKEKLYLFLSDYAKSESCLSGVAVCEEKHKDGSSHFHCFVDFSKKVIINEPREFDFLGIHPHISAVVNREKALCYMMKEDRKIEMDDHMQNLCCQWQSTALYVAEFYLKKGFGPDLTAEKMRHYGFTHYHKIRTWWKALQAANIRKQEQKKDGWPAVMEKFQGLPQVIFDALKFAAECSQKEIHRPLKSKNLLLWSSNPSVGKTTLTLELKKYLRTFDFPTDGWWDGYDDGFYDLVVWNECNFVGWQISDLNRLFEGSNLQLPIKGAKQTKTDNPLIICTSNLDLEGLLKQKGFTEDKVEFYLPILRTRIIEVEIKDEIWNFFFKF